MCVHVVVRTLKLEISRCHLADDVTELYESACSTCSTIIFPRSNNQIIVFWRRRCCFRRPCLSSLFMKPPFYDCRSSRTWPRRDREVRGIHGPYDWHRRWLCSCLHCLGCWSNDLLQRSTRQAGQKSRSSHSGVREL